MISIITPTLNSVEFIEKNILAVMNLIVPFEHIIVDGGSTDGTLEKIGQYSHLKLIDQIEASGMYGAIHLGFCEAKYEIITWVNSDDVIFPENFSQAVQKLKGEDGDFLYGDGFFYWAEKKKKQKIKGNPFAKFFLKKGLFPFLQPASIYKKSLYFSTQLHYDTFKICGDLDLFMRMANKKGVKFIYFQTHLVIFLKYGGSLGDRSNDKYVKERVFLIAQPNVYHKILFKITNILNRA